MNGSLIFDNKNDILGSQNINQSLDYNNIENLEEELDLKFKDELMEVFLINKKKKN